MSKNIFIFSEPLRSGKTTLLMNFAFQNKNVGGILTPDIDISRKLFDIERKEFHVMEVTPSDESIAIGKFHFSREAFEKAQKIILDASHRDFNWLIVDEVGKLELEQQTGLEPVISSVITEYRSESTQGNLLLVVRGPLLKECIDHYQLYDAEVINKDFFNNSIYHNNLQVENTIALIMCGGQSTRMGTNKSKINYHGTQQRYHLYAMLNELFTDVYLSVNKAQSTEIEPFYKVIIDDPDKTNLGPMAGLLTAMGKFPCKSFFVMGCDYPFLKKDHIHFFMSWIKDSSQPACFYNPLTASEEPLLAFYPANFHGTLKAGFSSSNRSLKKFLQAENALKIIPWDVNDITSVDTVEGYQQAMKKINGFLS